MRFDDSDTRRAARKTRSVAIASSLINSIGDTLGMESLTLGVLPPALG